VIDGVRFVPESSVPKPVTGNRVVLVIDRGWIYAGDVTEKDGRILLDRSVLVRCWSSIGFSGLLKDPKNKAVTLESVPFQVDVPGDAEIYRVRVPSDWGL
jgi:hypothetical protein